MDEGRKQRREEREKEQIADALKNEAENTYKEYIELRQQYVNEADAEKRELLKSAMLEKLGQWKKLKKELSTEEKPAEQKPAEQKPAEQKPAEQKPAEQKPAEQKPAEQKPAEQKPAEQKPAEQKPAEKKATEQKANKLIPEIVIGRKTYISKELGNKNNRSLLGGLKELLKSDKKILASSIDDIFRAVPGKLNKPGIKEKLEEVDPILLQAIIRAERSKYISREDAQNVILGVINKDKKAFENIISITYDREDLSKGAIFPWNKKAREKVAKYAEENKEIATLNGQYEPNLFKRLMKKVTTKKVGAAEQPKGKSAEKSANNVSAAKTAYEELRGKYLNEKNVEKREELKGQMIAKYKEYQELSGKENVDKKEKNPSWVLTDEQKKQANERPDTSKQSTNSDAHNRDSSSKDKEMGE